MVVQLKAEPTSSPASPPPRQAAARRAYAWEPGLVRRLLAKLGNPPIRISLWDGQTVVPEGPEPVAHIVFHTRRALLQTLMRPDPCFVEAYTAGQIDIEGDLVALLEAAYRAESSPAVPRVQRIARRRNPLKAARNNIHHHYDLGNDFYKLWLDHGMLYTCAYFPDPAMSLEAAQIAKMDHVCRKLRLEPGERVIEAGCGWGGLALHMARHYGVRVKAFNISCEQIAYARQQAREQNLDDRVEFIEDDYRHIVGECDAFVSVGMLEHVGPAQYRELGGIIRRCLGPMGRGLIHSIGRHRPMEFSKWIKRRIFPGAEPPTLRQMMELFESWDFAVQDVENLRQHYAMTVYHWRERFEKASGDITRMFDEAFTRTWRMYLAGSEAAFTTGTLQLYQVVFHHSDARDIPWSRADFYAHPHPPVRSFDAPHEAHQTP